MIELVFLGTSASAPSIQRGLSSAIVQHRDQRFMVDCGEGTQRQLLRSGLGFKRLNKILITHGHLDHILGLAGLVSTMARWEMIETLEIFGGAFALDRIRRLMDVVFSPHPIPESIVLREIRPGVIFATEHLRVEAFSVAHRGPDCFGYQFIETPKRPFLVEKAAALGVPAGPERRQLVEGQTVTLADGRIIHPDDVLGPFRQGARLTFIGDLARTRGLVRTVGRADALVVEATYMEPDKALARQYGHLTAAQAARLARNAGVRQLILTHISRRYSGEDILAEAKAIFPHTIVANDFDRFEIRRRMDDGDP
jgi:ribonuclease Z